MSIRNQIMISTPENLAINILRDLKIATGRFPTTDGYPPFEWLEPGYSKEIQIPHAIRLANGFACLHSVEAKFTEDALLVALNKAATSWIGAVVTLELLDWIHISAPHLFNPNDYIELLFHENPENLDETHFWISELINRYDAWAIKTESLQKHAANRSTDKWLSLIYKVSDIDRVAITLWVLRLLSHNKQITKQIFTDVIEEWTTNSPIPKGICDFEEEVVIPLREAAGLDPSDFGLSISRIYDIAHLKKYVGSNNEEIPFENQELSS